MKRAFGSSRNKTAAIAFIVLCLVVIASVLLLFGDSPQMYDNSLTYLVGKGDSGGTELSDMIWKSYTYTLTKSMLI